MKLITYTDGGARNNPGPAASGVVILTEAGDVVAGFGRWLGTQTNNYAEYMALILALERAKELGADTVECRMDSKLVAEQMSGNWRVKEPGLQVLFMRALKLSREFKQVKYVHVRREYNKEADAWVNRALDVQHDVS